MVEIPQIRTQQGDVVCVKLGKASRGMMHSTKPFACPLPCFQGGSYKI